MKTIHVGKYIRSSYWDRIINYPEVTPRVISGNRQHRPQFCLEFRGDRELSKIYASSAVVFERLRNILAADRPGTRLIVGEQVLGVQTFYYPTGWPKESADRIRVISAPGSILEQAEAALPPKPAAQFPRQKERGIEVIHMDGAGLIKRLAYHQKDLLTVRGNHLTLTSGSIRQEILSIQIVTANQALARQLGESIKRQTPRRLIINDQIIGVAMVLADNGRINLGDPNFKPEGLR